MSPLGNEAVERVVTVGPSCSCSCNATHEPQTGVYGLAGQMGVTVRAPGPGKDLASVVEREALLDRYHSDRAGYGFFSLV